MIEGYDDKPPGCLLVNMEVELAPWDHEVDVKVGESFDRMEQFLAKRQLEVLGPGQVVQLTRNDSSMKQRQSRTLFSRPWLSLFHFLGQSKTYFIESGGMTIRKVAWNIDTQSNTLFSAVNWYKYILSV
jgi:hypothetical protein